MEILAPVPPNGLPIQDPLPSTDPLVVLEHLSEVLQITLGAARRELEAVGSLLSKAKRADSIDRCARFASGAQVALYAQKDIIDEESLNSSNGDAGKTLLTPPGEWLLIPPVSLEKHAYSLSSELSVAPTTVASVAFIKRPASLDPRVPLPSQLQVINLPGLASLKNSARNQGTPVSPYEILHSVVHFALAPCFDAYAASQEVNHVNKGRPDPEAKGGVPGAKKKIAELEMTLLHLQQNIDIPVLHLPLHDVIRAALAEAASQNTRPSLDFVPKGAAENSMVLNSLQNHANGWIKSIRTITKMSRNAECDTAAQEISFWLSMESALANIEEQLSSNGVQLTMDVLRYAKRYGATLSFSADTGLKEAMDRVQKYNVLMHDFPLDDLLAATSLEKVEDALNTIFSHLNRKLRICTYPIRRTLALVEGISGDLDAQVHRLLNGRTIMHLDYREFVSVMTVAKSIWRAWDEDLKEFTNVARDVTRRRNEKFIPIKVSPRHTGTQERLKYISTFRHNHEQLQRTILSVLGPETSAYAPLSRVSKDVSVVDDEMGDVEAVEEVSEAYAAIKDVDVLDTSLEGTQLWVQAEMQYNERTSRVENSIIARLRDRLATAKTANEKFRVFSKFNALLVRPKVRGAISEYQTQLLDNVKDDIASLHERFKQQFSNSETSLMFHLRDLPPVAGSIIWVRQIERQLDSYLRRVEAVLGEDWTLHADGQKLQAESSLFRKKLDTRQLYESWVHDVQNRKLAISGRLFTIMSSRATGHLYELGVNFDTQVIALFKEVRNLSWLNFQVPHSINTLSKEASRVYPYAVSLIESARSYVQTTHTISGMSDVSPLLAGYQKKAQALIARGLPLRWESFVHSYELLMKQAGALEGGLSGPAESEHVKFVRDLAQSVEALQTKTAALVSINGKIQHSISDLKTCSFESSSLSATLDSIQNAVDKLNLENYANLGGWVERLNAEIEQILRERLEIALASWTATFNSHRSQDHARSEKRTGVSPNEHDDTIVFPSFRHELTMQNQLIYLDPPLESARSSWLEHLDSWLSTVCNLERIKSSRYQIATVSQKHDDFHNRFTSLPLRCVDTLHKAYSVVEETVATISAYIGEWLRYQSLWDLQSEQLFDVLGEDISRWHQLLLEIRQARSTFDTSSVKKTFGNVEISYELVQTKIASKYDQWQREVTSKFGGKLGLRMREVHHDISTSRKELEGQALGAASTAQAVAFITVVQKCRRKAKAWEPEMETFRQGQTTLTRQRYQFPSDWLPIDQVNHEWDAFKEILDRKSKVVEDQTEVLQAKITAEDRTIRSRIAESVVQWNEEKPISGVIEPDRASTVLCSFQTRFEKLQKESEMVSKAKESLDLPDNPDTTIPAVLAEVHDFISVWSALSNIWQSINELKGTSWASTQPRKLRQSIEGLVKITKDMPSRIRQYDAFEHVQKELRQLLKVNPLLTDLKSEAVRERHWVKIFKTLRPGKRYSEVSMTVGDVWDLKLINTEASIKDIIVQARGEMVLEEFVKQVRDTWQNYALDLVSYQSKCRLIRGWDDLFAKCSENLNSLQAMRHSPYYKEFEEEASSWEDKLNRIHVLFDAWIDVQRQWVYLEGVFSGNTDIKQLLPIESTRFQNINTEFFAVMKKVYKSPFVLDVLTIPGVQKSLERLADLLSKIQKALGEYLERERVSFPRFYFVGDEDLLEIIGNGNDTTRVAKHFNKMFAGISGLLVEDNINIVGITSKEGENVTLRKEVSLVKLPEINDWLAALETSVKLTLAEMLAEAAAQFESLMSGAVDIALLGGYLAAFPAQVVVLGTQVTWTKLVQQNLEKGGAGLSSIYESIVRLLGLLAATVLGELGSIMRRKCEHLITEFVHQRDVVGRLTAAKASSSDHHLWLLQMRYIYNADAPDLLQRLQVHMANAKLSYGYEYLGVPDRLVRTPLTDRCFLTLTQALCQRLGGSPYGPAGTGKTESVKALGLQLGRFTLVFCCDDTFDFQAMGRIFLGICQVGAWGCFDEFNRLEERILSAVSQQIQNIQIGLRHGDDDQVSQIELVGRRLRVNSNTGIFITMNPGYAGRSNLPDNLKKLFRSVAMSKPDKELIAEVMLFSQGFKQAKALSKQTVPFFDHCSSRLTKQAHYDFGLRALKSVLVSSGGLKRSRILTSLKGIDAAADADANIAIVEPQIIVQSIRETIAPKLVREDVNTLLSIQEEDFPGIEYIPAEIGELDAAIQTIAREQKLVISDAWMTKILQLNQIQRIHHGVMMVGSSGSGKSSIWKVLLQALQVVEHKEGVFHIIDSKVMSKEALYGSLDSTTREWTDGLFTGIIRKIVDNLRGEDAKRHWIVFDGDVDPEWVENLNSVLDDNKLLTLPNGERLSIPPNVRIMFEVETLKYATLATVSRCGMVWFSDDTVTSTMVVDNYLEVLKSKAFEDLDDDAASAGTASTTTGITQLALIDMLRRIVLRNDFLLHALEAARDYSHIMRFTDIRVLNSLFGLLSKVCRTVLEYNIQHDGFPLDEDQVEAFISRKTLLAVVWAFTGDCPHVERKRFGDYIGALSNVDLPPLAETASLIDYDVTLPQAQWTTWQNQVPSVEVNTHSVTQTDVIIPTVDTIRHEHILYSWLAEHKPLMLCGPPGSGKTMTLFSALRKLPNMEVVGLNFSSATTPELLIKTFDQYCEYRKTLNGVVLSPTQIGRWLVVFCDEINLPAPDRYGTQRAISFLRQLVEQNGFWKTADKTWVTLDRIQFVGACNPPTDAGRHPLGPRFLRHAPLIMVDYPGDSSLTQIYGTFNTAILKIIPLLRGYAGALTKAMVQFYSESQAKFTAKIQPHYVYSPRELTRWVRGIYEAIKPLESLSVEGLVRIWAHEALRLFQDRLVLEEERIWTADLVRNVAMEHFPNVDVEVALQSPILFSNWLSKNYVSVDQEQLREFVKARLKTFCEEEVDVPLVLFNDVLEHALRVDRVFRQPQGHLILIGVSGSGKTTLSRFVAWMNGLKIFQIKVHRNYSAEDFDEDLRGVLRACGCRGEKICFIMDESNVLDSGFLERMNTLLANGEVPGLFEGDEHSALMTACKEGAQRQGLLLDSQEELYKWFTQQIVKNLHVVFTMNPPQEGLSSKAATSPALFNRCVLNWMGDWSDQAFYQVGLELTQSLDLDKQNFTAPDSIPLAYRYLSLPASHRDAIINAMVYVHYSIQRLNSRMERQRGSLTYLTPRHYLDFVAHYVRLFNEKRESLEEQQRHLNVGLEKLRDTVDKVRDLRRSLAEKKEQLERKDAEANEKLQRMIADQREAETRKRASLEIQTALEKQDREVAQRREIVENDLARAEPAVLEAQRSVSNIKRQHLTEVRSMGNPPAGVKLALESVCTLLGHRADSWKTIQGIVRRDDFIASIVNYDNEQQMTPSLRKKMRNDYLSNDDFTYERVNRASKACGPLVQWVQAQVDFSEILDRVGPLREEVALLEEQALQTKAEAKAIENTITKLEESISTYKSEYAALISETQSIKSEMSRVQFKVSRSVSLLDSLSQERMRWEGGSKSFETQITTLIGDVLVAAAFLAYAGFYDQNERKSMVGDWLNQLSQSGIACKSHNPVTEYLSNADERLKWQQNSLPVDDLCTENAIILQRFNRYPLIIDPSGRTTEFLRRENKDRKLTVTSFLDDTFVKQLESALRFGNPILIQDAEHMDPILNHVLNKEYQKTGGRVLIQLGRQEIDFSPAFRLYMSTRDPSAAFPPDICSRATFVNFTVTRSSLQTQSLNEVLKSERPEVDVRRTNLIKLQGEFNTNLRRLERKLLQALNESRGNILDDDHVIETLETLKKEATEISKKMVETEGVMTEVENITLEYSGIAKACSAIFAVLEQLHQLNHSYQFSLQYFLDIFNSVLHDSKRFAGETNLPKRGEIILCNIFTETYRRTSMSLLQKDRITLAMLLARASPYEMDRSVLDIVLDQRITGSDISTTPEQRSHILSSISHVALVRERFARMSEQDWTRLANEEHAEHVTPALWDSGATLIDQRLLCMLIVKLFRLDRLVPAAERFVVAVFGEGFFDSVDDLGTVVKQVTASTPIALSSSPGFDASYKVDGLVEGTRSICANIAMGSSEGAASADKAISNAAANGTWVLVKNVHLAPQWLQSLEKRLSSLKPHGAFRLFLSMESSPKIPANLIRASRILKYEQPAGIRANMKDSISSLSIRASRPPVEKARLYFLLSFLHAVIQERLRYAPTLGWKGFWEFNDSDVSIPPIRQQLTR
jgi:dynein heavy chain 1, cytosolic